MSNARRRLPVQTCHDSGRRQLSAAAVHPLPGALCNRSDRSPYPQLYQSRWLSWGSSEPLSFIFACSNRALHVIQSSRPVFRGHTGAGWSQGTVPKFGTQSRCISQSPVAHATVRSSLFITTLTIVPYLAVLGFVVYCCFWRYRPLSLRTSFSIPPRSSLGWFVRAKRLYSW
jgi:hypothetical protein